MLKRISPIFLFFIFLSCSGELTGVISVKGNAPHTYLAFTTETGDLYRVEGSKTNELREKFQGVKVKLKGTLIKKQEKNTVGPGVIEVTEIIEVFRNG
jgi:hypothetical protein